MSSSTTDHNNGSSAKRSALEILKNYNGPAVRIMEVCGTHTHEIFRLGIRRILPPSIRLISGPGCPVCVTPVSFIDEALILAEEHGCTICTFGDLVRVPGTKSSLQKARGTGARVQVSGCQVGGRKRPSELLCFDSEQDNAGRLRSHERQHGSVSVSGPCARDHRDLDLRGSGFPRRERHLRGLYSFGTCDGSGCGRDKI